MIRKDVLGDVLKPGLRAVICGTTAGTRSAVVGAYYANPGNSFWSVIEEIGLTPTRLSPPQFKELLKYRIGLTDIAKNHHGADANLPPWSYDIDSFKAKIDHCRPVIVAFNGKEAARAFYGLKKRRDVRYGLQRSSINPPIVFVLPSTSGVPKNTGISHIEGNLPNAQIVSNGRDIPGQQQRSRGRSGVKAALCPPLRDQEP